MASPLTLRLDEDTRMRIARIAENEGVSASEVIRCAIGAWVDRREAVATPYDLLKDLIGVVHGGDARRSTRTGRQLKEMLEKRARSR